MAANVLDRSFSPDAPDRVWAVDMTYIATGEGWLYLSVVLDLYSRRFVGWSAQPSLTRRGPADALSAAIRTRRPEPGLIHHSDQGSQYTSDEYRSILRRHGLVASMSRRGSCHDNAPTEGFFASLKSDVVRGRRFETHAEARSVLFAYIETFYNRRRRHSSLGYLTPGEHEQRTARSRPVFWWPDLNRPSAGAGSDQEAPDEGDADRAARPTRFGAKGSRIRRQGGVEEGRQEEGKHRTLSWCKSGARAGWMTPSCRFTVTGCPRNPLVLTHQEWTLIGLRAQPGRVARPA